MTDDVIATTEEPIPDPIDGSLRERAKVAFINDVAAADQRAIEQRRSKMQSAKDRGADALLHYFKLETNSDAWTVLNEDDYQVTVISPTIDGIAFAYYAGETSIGRGPNALHLVTDCRYEPHMPDVIHPPAIAANTIMSLEQLGEQLDAEARGWPTGTGAHEPRYDRLCYRCAAIEWEREESGVRPMLEGDVWHGPNDVSDRKMDTITIDTARFQVIRRDSPEAKLLAALNFYLAHNAPGAMNE